MLNTLNLKTVSFLFLVLGFVLYGNTLGHDYALDDTIVITENDFTKRGFSGIWDQLSNDQFVGFYGQKKELVSGGRYRPLSMVMFNIEYAFFGANPFIGHFMNVLWYILNGILLYLVLQKLIPEGKSKFKIPFVLTVSLLWFFHPIHTEVVANIKGRDEIMAFCGELLTLLLLLQYLEKKTLKNLLLVPLVFFLALFSKENAITWLAIFPLAIYFFKKDELKALAKPYLLIILSSGIWFFIRYQVVGGGISDVADTLMNDPFLQSTTSDKYATIMLTLGKYLQLLAFPHPLTFDYYPKHIPIVSWNNPLVILSCAAYLLLAIAGVYGLFKRKLYSFAIAVFVITLSIASNLIFPIGAFMNERFVYVSSLGFCLILAEFFYFGLPALGLKPKQSKQFLQIGLFTILSLYSIKTISRNPVWKDNLTLATNDAMISINGAKSNVMAGGLLLEEVPKTNNPQEKQELLDQSIYHLQRALEIYPDYVDALLLMGNAQWEMHKQASKAMPYYFQILNINNQNANVWSNAFIILEQEKDANYKVQAYENLKAYDPDREKVYVNLGRAYGQGLNNLNQAESIFRDGLQRFPNSFELYNNLGTVYGLQGRYTDAILALQKASQIRPNYAKTYIDLGLSYYHLNELDQAKAAFDKAQQLDPGLDRSKLPL